MPGTMSEETPQTDRGPASVEPAPSSAKRKRILLIAGGFIASLLLFWVGTQRHSHQYNTKARMEKHDQLAIMNFSRRVYRSLHTPGAPFYSGTRNKMPMYPFLQSLFIRDVKESNDALFERGKTLNVYITMAGLIAVGIVFFRTFPTHLAANLSLIAAFSVFVFKAAYFQPDTLSYFLAFGVFLLMWRLFARGGIVTAIVCGVLLALAHYCKGTAPPMLMLFGVFYGGAAVFALFRKFTTPRVEAASSESGRPITAVPTAHCRPAWRSFVELALVFVVALGILSPYLRESKQRFGSYFYNVNSTFYMWLDSWDEAKKFSEMYDDRHKAPDIPADQLPGLKTYLHTHTTGQVVTRMWKGLGAQLSISLHSYGYMVYLIAYGAVIGFAIWKAKLKVVPYLKRQPFLAAFLLAYFGGYYALYSWYEYVGRGQRFIIGLFLPALFTLGFIYVRLVVPSKIQIPIGRRTVPLGVAANWAITVYCLLDIIYTISYEVVVRNGGS